MSKKIKECTVEELMTSQSKNKGNDNYTYVYEVILIMFDSVKDKPQVKGIEMEVLNDAWKTVKTKFSEEILNTIVNV